MTVPDDREWEILRLHYGEHWPIGTSAKQHDVHAEVVRRVLGHTSGEPVVRRSSRW